MNLKDSQTKEEKNIRKHTPSRIETLLDEFVTPLAQRKGITSLYLLVAGLFSVIYGLYFSTYWRSLLALLAYAHMFIALITMVIGVVVWFSKSQAKSMSRLALGCIILNILVMLLLYPIEFIELNRFIIEIADASPKVRAHQLWGLILLGIWLFPLISHLLARYRSTKTTS
jgi:Na+/H+-translocating membrane pyrophosphatase